MMSDAPCTLQAAKLFVASLCQTASRLPDLSEIRGSLTQIMSIGHTVLNLIHPVMDLGG